MAKIKAGTYRVNENLSYENVTERDFLDIVFSCVVDGETQEYECINIDPISNQIEYYSPNVTDEVYKANWADEAYRTITIAEDTEVYDATLYEWFTANTDETKPISGMWKFNDIPTIQAMSEKVSFYSYNGFTSEYQTFYGFYATGIEMLNYYTADDYASQTWVVDKYATWRAEQCKTIDFGTGTKIVSATFHNWFTANATPIERPKLEGVWELNETLTRGIASNVVVPFISNGRVYTNIFTSSNANNGDWICVKYVKPTDTTIQDADNAYYFMEYEFGGNPIGWTKTAYRTVEFLPVEQVVTLEFYAWLKENATRAKDQIDAGTYQFKDGLDFDSVPIGTTIQLDSPSVVYLEPDLAEEQGVPSEQTCDILSVQKIYVYEPNGAQHIGCYVRAYFSAANEWVDVYSRDYEHIGWRGIITKTIVIPNDTEASGEFCEWFSTNTVKEPEATLPTTITYNGRTIASLIKGQTATLKCAGMKMDSDVIVEAGEGGSGTGECNHEVYDLSYDSAYYITLKPKIEKPTAAQSDSFVDGNIALITEDVERLQHIIHLEYFSDLLESGLPIPVVHVRQERPSDFDAYYVWEEDVENAKAVLASAGADVSGVTGEGWQVANEMVVRTLTDEEVELFDLRILYYYSIPYNDYMNSLFNLRTYVGREPVDIVNGSHTSYFTLKTQGKLCEKDIYVRQDTYDDISVDEKDGYISLSSDAHYHRLAYIDVVAVGEFDPGAITLEGHSYDYYGNVVKQSFRTNLGGERTTDTIVVQDSIYGITIENSQGAIGAVYTNATIVSQSETEIYISGIRHDTHIVIMAEETA